LWSAAAERSVDAALDRLGEAELEVAIQSAVKAGALQIIE